MRRQLRASTWRPSTTRTATASSIATRSATCRASPRPTTSTKITTTYRATLRDANTHFVNASTSYDYIQSDNTHPTYNGSTIFIGLIGGTGSGSGAPRVRRRADRRRQEPDLEPERPRQDGLGALDVQPGDAVTRADTAPARGAPFRRGRRAVVVFRRDSGARAAPARRRSTRARTPASTDAGAPPRASPRARRRRPHDRPRPAARQEARVRHEQDRRRRPVLAQRRQPGARAFEVLLAERAAVRDVLVRVEEDRRRRCTEDDELERARASAPRAPDRRRVHEGRMPARGVDVGAGFRQAGRAPPDVADREPDAARRSPCEAATRRPPSGAAATTARTARSRRTAPRSSRSPRRSRSVPYLRRWPRHGSSEDRPRDRQPGARSPTTNERTITSGGTGRQEEEGEHVGRERHEAGRRRALP